MNTDQMRQAAAVITALADAGITMTSVTNHWPDTGPPMPEVHCYTNGAEQFADATRTLTGLAGKVDKEPTDDGVMIAAAIDGVRVALRDISNEVCKKILVGTDLVEEQVPDPEWDGEVPMVTVTREVPRYEIQCPDSLLALTRDRVAEPAA